MARQVLNTSKGGINLLRTKGGPSPNNLMDALNCYIDPDGLPQSRPGTEIKFQLGTSGRAKGLMAFQGALVSFSHQVEGPQASGMSIIVLVNPNDQSQPIKDIHFAGAYLGQPYVVAEFANGDVYHYWLQEAKPWQPNTIYMLGDLVSPTTPNGLAYRAGRVNPAAPVWQPNQSVSIGDVREPTEFDGYQYTVSNTIGANPRTGATEPDWNAATGAITYEDVDVSGNSTSSGTQADPTNTPSAEIEERYNNPGGNRPNTNKFEAQ